MKNHIRIFSILAISHFLIGAVCGCFLFLSQEGFTKSDATRIFETIWGAGVVILGLPDTVLGWLLNSCLYAFALSLLFHMWNLYLKAIPDKSS
ncbi:MAG TPA: hypothetical protein VGH19_14955 [Verrucomicrobiae bacterium]